MIQGRLTMPESEIQSYLRQLRDERQLSRHTVAAYDRDLASLHAFLDDYFGASNWVWKDVDRLADFIEEKYLLGLNIDDGKLNV